MASPTDQDAASAPVASPGEGSGVDNPHEPDRSSVTAAAPTAPRLDDLHLGATSPKKVVHHGTCPHARRPYLALQRCQTIEEVFVTLNGAWSWHRFCQSCCGDLEDALNKLRKERVDARG